VNTSRNLRIIVCSTRSGGVGREGVRIGKQIALGAFGWQALGGEKARIGQQGTEGLHGAETRRLEMQEHVMHCEAFRDGHRVQGVGRTRDASQELAR
jgi:hypothetical protein